MNIVKIKSKINKNYTSFIILVLIFFTLNFSRFSLDTYNLEWYFVELSKYFNNSEHFFDIFLFKQNQANTTFYSFLLSFLNLFQITDYNQFAIYRLLNFTILFVLIYFVLTFKLINYETKTILIFATVFSPIVNVYIFRIYPDLLSASFCWLSIILLLKKYKNFSVITFGISFLLKPVSIIAFPIFFYIINKTETLKIDKIKLLLKYLSFLTFLYLIYIFTYEKIIFGNYYKSTYISFNLINSVLNFVYYYNYIILITSPFLIYQIYIFINKDIYKFSHKIYFMLITTVTSIILYLFSFKNGEMNYGYLNKFLSSEFILFFFIFINTFFGILFLFINLKNKKNKKLFILFIISLIFLSLLIARPTQRYLVYLLPLSFLLITNLYENKAKHLKISLLIFVLLFSIISFGQKIVQEKTLNSTKFFLNYINKNNLFSDTHPGLAYHSHGHLFENYLQNEIQLKKQINYNYKIDNCDNNQLIILNSDVNFFKFKLKKRCLVKLINE